MLIVVTSYAPSKLGSVSYSHLCSERSVRIKLDDQNYLNDHVANPAIQNLEIARSAKVEDKSKRDANYETWTVYKIFKIKWTDGRATTRRSFRMKVKSPFSLS